MLPPWRCSAVLACKRSIVSCLMCHLTRRSYSLWLKVTSVTIEVSPSQDASTASRLPNVLAQRGQMLVLTFAGDSDIIPSMLIITVPQTL